MMRRGFGFLLLIFAFLFHQNNIQTRAFPIPEDDLDDLADVPNLEAFVEEGKVDEQLGDVQKIIPKKLPTESITEFLKGQGADVGEYGLFFEGDLLLPLPEITPSGLIADNNLWADNIVKYKFAEDVVLSDRDKIRIALDEMEEKTCVEFEEIPSRTASPRPIVRLRAPQTKTKKKKKKKPRPTEPPPEEEEDLGDFVLVTTHKKGCYTNVGRQGGRQEMNLNSKGCLRTGTIIHEFVHTLGFRHEQSRPDRDSYITINFNNIAPQFKSNFARSQINAMQVLRNPYDYNSLLHYGPFSFAIDRNIETIQTKIPGKKIGQRVGLSVLDIEKINDVYKCSDGDSDNDSD